MTSFNHMKKITIDQSGCGRNENTEIAVRCCVKRDGPAIEVHIEHFKHSYDAKNGRTHYNFPTMTVEEAEQLCENFAEAIKEAKRRRLNEAA